MEGKFPTNGTNENELFHKEFVSLTFLKSYIPPLRLQSRQWPYVTPY